MRLGNLAGRAVVFDGERAIDVELASGGRFPAEPEALFERWAEFRDWHSSAQGVAANRPPEEWITVDPERLGAPSPRPRQVFAIASNYHGRASVVAGSDELPVIFTKFPSSIVGPHSKLPLPTASVDWEVEIVVVIGKSGYQIPAAEAWDMVAGLTLGQDFSERELQLGGPAKQFSLGKSFPFFGPTGPVLVTPDEFADREDIELGCSVNGNTVQSDSTARLIFPIAELVSRISAICELYPGDLIFSGTPSGMGMQMTPPQYLEAGDLVESFAPEIGTMTTRCVPVAG